MKASFPAWCIWRRVERLLFVGDNLKYSCELRQTLILRRKWFELRIHFKEYFPVF